MTTADPDRPMSYRTNVRPEARLPTVAPRAKWWRLAWWALRGGPVRLWWWRRHEWVDEIGQWLPCWTRVRVPKSDPRANALRREFACVRRDIGVALEQMYGSGALKERRFPPVDPSSPPRTPWRCQRCGATTEPCDDSLHP